MTLFPALRARPAFVAMSHASHIPASQCGLLEQATAIGYFGSRIAPCISDAPRGGYCQRVGIRTIAHRIEIDEQIRANEEA